MRIALITLYDAYNCGSFLQAFSMQIFLEQQGHTVDVLDCNTNKWRWVKRLIAITPRRQYIKIKKRISYGKAWKKLNIVRLSKGEHYDVAVLGSDEIWNLSNPYFEHWPQYFGKNIPAQFSIAYAPSVGYADVKMLMQNESVKSLKYLTKVFARDDNTAKLAQSVRSESIQRVCDPTLLITEKWRDLEYAYPMKNPYVIIYSYNPDFSVKTEIQQFAKDNKCEVVSVAFDCSWADRIVIPTPMEFLYLVHHARAIYGSTFHISVFASIFQVPFCVKSNMQKTEDFLSITNQNWRIYKKSGDILRVFCDEKNKRKDRPWIPERLIEESKNLFINALSDCDKCEKSNSGL